MVSIHKSLNVSDNSRSILRPFRGWLLPHTIQSVDVLDVKYQQLSPVHVQKMLADLLFTVPVINRFRFIQAEFMGYDSSIDVRASLQNSGECCPGAEESPENETDIALCDLLICASNSMRSLLCLFIKYVRISSGMP